MKFLTFIIVLTFLPVATSIAQVNGVDGSEAYKPTKYIVEELTRLNLNEIGYSDEQLDKLYSKYRLIKFYNYFYSRSFDIKEGQTFTTEDILKIRIGKYDEIRDESDTVEVLDEDSGLLLVLRPFEEIEAKLVEFGVVDPDQSPSDRICSNCD